MNRSDHPTSWPVALAAGAVNLTASTGPAQVAAALVAAGTILGRLAALPDPGVLSRCSFAVVSIDAAVDELRTARDVGFPSPLALPSGLPTEPATVVPAVVTLLAAAASALRLAIERGCEPRRALACARAVLHLEDALRLLGEARS